MGELSWFWKKKETVPVDENSAGYARWLAEGNALPRLDHEDVADVLYAIKSAANLGKHHVFFSDRALNASEKKFLRTLGYTTNPGIGRNDSLIGWGAEW